MTSSGGYTPADPNLINEPNTTPVHLEDTMIKLFSQANMSATVSGDVITFDTKGCLHFLILIELLSLGGATSIAFAINQKDDFGNRNQAFALGAQSSAPSMLNMQLGPGVSANAQQVLLSPNAVLSQVIVGAGTVTWDLCIYGHPL